MINISQHFRYYEHIKDAMPRFRQVQHPIIQDLRNKLGYDESNHDQLINAHQLLEYLNSVLSNNTTVFSTSSLTNAFLRQIIYEVIQDHPNLDSFSGDANPYETNQQLDDIIEDLQTDEPVIFKTIRRNQNIPHLSGFINQMTENTLENTNPINYLNSMLQALDDDQLNSLVRIFSKDSSFYRMNFSPGYYFWAKAKIPLENMRDILNEPQPDRALIFAQSLVISFWNKSSYVDNDFANNKVLSGEFYTNHKHIVLNTDCDLEAYADSIIALHHHLRRPTDNTIIELAEYQHSNLIKNLLRALASSKIQPLSPTTIHNIIQSNEVRDNLSRLANSDAEPNFIMGLSDYIPKSHDNSFYILTESIILQCLTHSDPILALQTCYILTQHDMLNYKDALLTTLSTKIDEVYEPNTSNQLIDLNVDFLNNFSCFLFTFLKNSAYLNSEEKDQLLQTITEQQFLDLKAIHKGIITLNDVLKTTKLPHINWINCGLFDLYIKTLTHTDPQLFAKSIDIIIQNAHTLSLSKDTIELADSLTSSLGKIEFLNTRVNIRSSGTRRSIKQNIINLLFKGDQPKQHLIPKLKKLLSSMTIDNNNADFTTHNDLNTFLKQLQLTENFEADPVLDFLEDDNAETIIDELSNRQLLTDHNLELIVNQQEATEAFQRPNRDKRTYYQNASKIIQILDPEARAYLQPNPLLYLNQLLSENGIEISDIHQNIQNDQQRGLVSAFLTYMLQIIDMSQSNNIIVNQQINQTLKNLILNINNINDQKCYQYQKLLTHAQDGVILTKYPELLQSVINYADEHDIEYTQLIDSLKKLTQNGSCLEPRDLRHPSHLLEDISRLYQIQQYYDHYQSGNLNDITRHNLDTLQKNRTLQYILFRKLVNNNQIRELLKNTPSNFFAHTGRLLVCFQIADKQYDNNTVDVTRYNIDDLQRIIEAFIRLESCFNNLDEAHRLEQTQQNNLQNFQRLDSSQQINLIATLTYYQVTPDELEELIKLNTQYFKCESALGSILHFWTNHDIELTNLITRVNDLTAEATSLLVDNLKTNSHYHTQLVNSILKARPISTPDSSTNTENADQHVAKMRAQKLFSETDLINLSPCIDLVNDTTMQSSNAVVTLDKDLLDDQTILQGLQEKYAIDTNSRNTNVNPFINKEYLERFNTSSQPLHPMTRQPLNLEAISDSNINLNLLKTYLQDYHESTYFQQRLATVLLIDDLLQAKASIVKAMHEANSTNQTNSGAMYPQLTEQGADINEAIQQLNSSSDIYDMQTHFINILNKMDQAHTLSHFATQLGPYHASLANTVASLCHTRKNANDSDTQPGITLKDMTQHYTLTADDRILAASNQGCYENTHNDENTHNAAARPSF